MARAADIYEYRAQVLTVHDGDTITVMLDQGLKEYRKMNIRFYGINAPEIGTAAGKVSRTHLLTLLGMASAAGPGPSVIIRTIRDAADKYGERWDGNVWLESAGTWGVNNEFVTTGPSVNQQMVADGAAVLYP